MRHSFSNPSYGASGEGKCWEMFHPELRNGPYCGKDLDHEGDHRGFNLSWPEEPLVDKEIAERFLRAYRQIPNGTEGIVLNDDATVTMTLSGLEAAVRFIHVSPSDD